MVFFPLLFISPVCAIPHSSLLAPQGAPYNIVMMCNATIDPHQPLFKFSLSPMPQESLSKCQCIWFC